MTDQYSPNTNSDHGLPQENLTTRYFLRIVIIWHILLSITTLVGIIFLWVAGVDFPTYQRIIASVFMTLIGIAITVGGYCLL
jgi:hypothetical protein